MTDRSAADPAGLDDRLRVPKMRVDFGLRLALFLGLSPVVSGLRLLSNPPFNCSQPDLQCLVENSTCVDQSWYVANRWTPSAPSLLYVHLDTFFGEDGKLFPVLKIEWTVATDASIQFLKGAELSVLQVSSNKMVCTCFEFQDQLSSQVRPGGGGPWNFSFNRFAVQPGQTYQVTVYHLPKLSTSGDYNQKSLQYKVPDCMNPIMKATEPCQQIGSLWEPNIYGRSLDDETLLLTFDPAMESAKYVIYVTSFQEDGRECKKTMKESQEHNVTVKVERNLKSCCKYKVQIQPFFADCVTDCMRREAVIPCVSTPELLVADDLSLCLPWGITLVCILLVASAVISAVCYTRRQKASHSGTDNRDGTHQGVLPMTQSPPPLKSCKVWIIYSADHKLYVDIVMKFAQFMIRDCGTEVILDRLNERQISEMGAVRWLTRQKQEMEALTSKIIILCSRGTRAKWQAMLGGGNSKVSLRQDNLLPIGDMFTPALNLILPDFKQPGCFGMYLVCYFEGISDEKDIPDPFNVTSKYQLMNKFEDVYFLIQDLEKFEPGKIHQIPAISPEKYAESPSGRQLKEAVQKFQKWQAEHPDWFTRENAYCADEGDLQSLNDELSEASMLTEGGILRKNLLPQEPDPDSCCLVNLLANEDELETYTLLPQLLPQEDLVFQNMVLPADETSQVQMVAPVALEEDTEIFTHQLLTSEDWQERVALMEPSIPRRQSVILQEDLSSSSQLLPADVKLQLKGLMYSLYQQSISSDPSLCQKHNNDQEQQLVFAESCKDQRQSVQSDQGYISRSSPLPSDGTEGEEEGHGTSRDLTPDVLNSIKSLQQQLLFQDIQQSFS